MDSLFSEATVVDDHPQPTIDVTATIIADLIGKSNRWSKGPRQLTT
jgi:hypothetical protein